MRPNNDGDDDDCVFGCKLMETTTQHSGVTCNVHAVSKLSDMQNYVDLLAEKEMELQCPVDRRTTSQ